VLREKEKGVVRERCPLIVWIPDRNIQELRIHRRTFFSLLPPQREDRRNSLYPLPVFVWLAMM